MDNTNKEDLYDEFGNYVGPDLASSDEASTSDEGSSSSNKNNDDQTIVSEMEMDVDENHDQSAISSSDSLTAEPINQIILHEDKVHYPSASTIYGPNVTTAIIDEDAMDISEPILPRQSSVTPAQVISPRDHDDSKQLVSDDYLIALSDNTRTKRGLAIVGNLQSGKTTLVDLLLQHTMHEEKRNCLQEKNPTIEKYTDTLNIEREKKLSLKSTAITLPLPTSKRTYALTLFDNPGHIQFHDESVATLKISDGCVIVLDVIEGLTLHDEMLLRQIISEGLNMILVLNKVDRLILDLKLPIGDAYYKIRNVIDEVNSKLLTFSNGRYPKFCPTKNVAFSSALHGWVFSLESIAEMYVDHVDDVECLEGEFDGSPNRTNIGVLGKNLSINDFTNRL